VHLRACVTDGVFVPAAAEAGTDAPPAVLPARSITQADLAAVTKRVLRGVIRWLSRSRLLDVAAAADMLAWEHSGLSSMPVSGSRSFVSNCVTSVSPWSISCGTVPGRLVRSSDSP
jgi:hypothetical protein